MRTVILHYHLFKNAGTTVDQCLKAGFGERWATAEFSPVGGNNTPAVEDWIKATPKAQAYSSHTMLGPLPFLPGVQILGVTLLRDPIERILSAYYFEKTQQADTFGSNLAKRTSPEEYAKTRLSNPGDRQCRNFQTYRLAQLVPGPGSELERACKALDALEVVGRVERIEAGLNKIREVTEKKMAVMLPDRVFHANKSSRPNVGLDPEAQAQLIRANADDYALLEALERKTSEH